MRILKLGESLDITVDIGLGADVGVTYINPRTDLISISSTGVVKVISDPTQSEQVFVQVLDEHGLPIHAVDLLITPAASNVENLRNVDGSTKDTPAAVVAPKFFENLVSDVALADLGAGAVRLTWGTQRANEFGYTIEITNAEGTVVKTITETRSGTSHSTDISFADLSAGVYHARVKTPNNAEAIRSALALVFGGGQPAIVLATPTISAINELSNWQTDTTRSFDAYVGHNGVNVDHFMIVVLDGDNQVVASTSATPAEAYFDTDFYHLTISGVAGMANGATFKIRVDAVAADNTSVSSTVSTGTTLNLQSLEAPPAPTFDILLLNEGAASSVRAVNLVEYNTYELARPDGFGGIMTLSAFTGYWTQSASYGEVIFTFEIPTGTSSVEFGLYDNVLGQFVIAPQVYQTLAAETTARGASKFIVEVLTPTGVYALLNELVIRDQDNQIVPFTTTATDAYDTSENNTPFYWNDGGNYGRQHLSDGDISGAYEGGTAIKSDGTIPSRFMIDIGNAVYSSLAFEVSIGGAAAAAQNWRADTLRVYSVEDTYNPATMLLAPSVDGLVRVGFAGSLQSYAETPTMIDLGTYWGTPALAYPLQVMTADNAPTPYVATASSNYSDGTRLPFHAFNGVGQPGPNAWVAAGVPNSGAPEYLQIDLGVEIVLKSYDITPPDQSWIFGSGPGSWQIIGSPSGLFNGDEVMLDTRSSQAFTAETNFATPTVTQGFRHFRLVATANQGGGYYGIAALKLNGIAGAGVAQSFFAGSNDDFPAEALSTTFNSTTSMWEYTYRWAKTGLEVGDELKISWPNGTAISTPPIKTVTADDVAAGYVDVMVAFNPGFVVDNYVPATYNNAIAITWTKPSAGLSHYTFRQVGFTVPAAPPAGRTAVFAADPVSQQIANYLDIVSVSAGASTGTHYFSIYDDMGTSHIYWYVADGEEADVAAASWTPGTQYALATNSSGTLTVAARGALPQVSGSPLEGSVIIS